MGRRKRKSPKNQLSCNICENSYPSTAFIVRSCQTNHIPSTVDTCQSCLYQHIFTTLSRDITDHVVCPMQGCHVKISRNIIQSVLAQFNPDYLQQYMTKSTWHGTSEQWIDKFAARCPYCSVPIEKNGGCNQVVCSRCSQRFDWQLAKTSKFYPYSARLRPRTAGIRTLCIRLMMVFLTLFVTFVLVFAGKFISSVGNLWMNLPGLTTIYEIGFFK